MEQEFWFCYSPILSNKVKYGGEMNLLSSALLIEMLFFNEIHRLSFPQNSTGLYFQKEISKDFFLYSKN